MTKGLRNILLVFILFLPVTKAWGLSADFTADVIAGCPPLVVHFTNSSTGATSYQWNLGNSTPLFTSTNASGSYLTTGTYTVTLTAYNGSSSSTHTMVITVYPLPTVNFMASDTAICPGVPITFTSTSTGGVPGPMTYEWNFGDGHGSLVATPVYAYATSGYFNVTLSVTNNQGCTKSLTKDQLIHVYTPAVIDFPNGHYCHPPATVDFTSTLSGTMPFTYLWTFGDGSPTSVLAGPSHTYSTTGSFTVELKVTDGHGCTDSAVVPGDIYVGDIAAHFTLPTSACLYAPVTFTNTSISYTTSNWNFGDHTTDTSGSPTHTYTSPGIYTITLIVSDGTCLDTISHNITILPAPVCSFTITPTEPCPATTTLDFNSTVPAGSTVTWQFGDHSATGSGVATTHPYTHNGVDTISMSLITPAGCKDTISQVFSIYSLRININNDTIPMGCVPLNVRFDCWDWTTVPDSILYHPYPYGIATYTWNFGDGSPTITGGGIIYHTYTAVGIYTCKLSIVTPNGCTDSATILVLVGQPPIANFIAEPTTVCADRTVSFINESTGADGFLWLFGDGHISSEIDPVDTYQMPGIYSDTLIAFDNGCPDTFIRTNYITVDSPKSIIFLNYVCSPANEVEYRDTSLGDNSHLWIFGDGDTSSLEDPIHFYPSLTTYTVTLTTYNIASGCHDTAHLRINLERPIPNFTADDTAICIGGIVHFTPVIPADSIIYYAWFRNDTLREDTARLYTDTFNRSGLFTITLVIEDTHLCYDTLEKEKYIIVAKPNDSFTVSPQYGCWPLTVTLSDQSTDVTGTFFTRFTWAYGDGDTSIVTTSVSTHTYTNVGTFGVQEIVTDNIGCKDTVTFPDLVSVYRPLASFYANTLYPCIGYPDYFFNTSTGVISSIWLFGDGDSSTSESTIHVYGDTGIFSVSLVVTDMHGCKDTTTDTGYIKVTRPVAGFHMDDSFSICPPLDVNFINTSFGGAINYNWTFGDGNVSVLLSPADLYITPGLYPVQLVAINLYGCTDTAIGHVNIFGYAGSFTYAPLTGCTPLTVNFNAAVSNVPTVIWDFDDGVTTLASGIDTASHTYTSPGFYVPKLILSDNTGCQNSSPGLDTIKVDIVTPGFKTTLPVCLKDTFLMIDTSHSYWSKIDSWKWYFGNDSGSTDTSSYAYDSIGTFPITLIVTDAWGCSASDVENITVYPPPTIKVSADTVICIGDKATLEGYGGESYTWSPPVGLSCTKCNPTKADPMIATTYTVTGTDKNGCVNSDTVTVKLKTKTVSVAGNDTAICAGESVKLTDSGATSYTWIPETGLSNPDIGDPIASPLVNTTYMIVAKLGSCIPDTNYINVIVNPLPIIHAGPDQTLVAGSTAQLFATGSGYDSLWWNESGTLSCDTCYNPVASMTLTTTYVANAKTPFGCRKDDSVTIHLICNSSQIWFPNAFTPNGDGQDDVFYPRGKGVSEVKAFRIYNRWGNLLFERDEIQLNDASNGWDGTFNGDLPHPDVYVYLLDAVCETGEPIFIKGDVTIIR